MMSPFKCYIMKWEWRVERVSITKVYGSALLALRGGGGAGCSISRRKKLQKNLNDFMSDDNL